MLRVGLSNPCRASVPSPNTRPPASQLDADEVTRTRLNCSLSCTVLKTLVVARTRCHNNRRVNLDSPGKLYPIRELRCHQPQLQAMPLLRASSWFPLVEQLMRDVRMAFVS